MIRLKSLQQRLMLFLFLPVAALLIGMGILGFVYARNSLLTQWREAAVLKLQRAAHDVDMRLRHLLNWLEMYNDTGGEYFDEHTQEWIIEQLRQQKGVVKVELDRIADEANEPMLHMHMQHHGGQGPMMSSMMRFHRAKIAEITPPHYDSLLQHDTVSIISELHDKQGSKLGNLEVVISFQYLLENLGATGWWQSRQAFLVDNTGKVLICTDPDRRQLGENNDPVELATLKAIKEKKSGTILGPGHPPDEVGGFYHLKEAPWSLVMVAPGKAILAPIVKFRNFYIVGGSLFVLLILLLIRVVTGRTVSSIKDVSSAAESIAHGDYSAFLPVKSADEVGQLMENFNTMASQLQERVKLKQELNLAMEVQQSLLPHRSPPIEGFDIAGKSIYCEETGGDYYDFIEFPELGEGYMGVAVGDVAGHGIAPALLMTTVRAFLRSRVLTRPEDLADAITDVNRLLCIDTAETSNFMTLFFLLIDSGNGKVRWVRAGHEPAMIYDPSNDSFEELHGRGIALGVDETWSFEEQIREVWSDSQIVLIGTDGIWESENPQGESFGKRRLKEVIRQHKDKSSEEIVQAIMDALANHRKTAAQQDDVTLVVIKKV